MNSRYAKAVLKCLEESLIDLSRARVIALSTIPYSRRPEKHGDHRALDQKSSVISILSWLRERRASRRAYYAELKCA
jgi:hypothetical protein